MNYDLVIRGGTVVDGSGLGRYRADVAVRGDRIARIGRVQERGKREIDADGQVVTPGFIDGHTHMDAQVFWDPIGSSSCWHGITSVVMGNCGFTLAPVKPDRHDLVLRNLERAEDIPAPVLAQGVKWSWEHFRDYLSAVDRTPKAINYTASIGHSALRTWAMGEGAFERDATERELQAMQAEIRDALDAGAFGFSTSRNNLHETSDDRPVASRRAPWSEVCALVQTVADHGSGYFQIAHEGSVRGSDEAAHNEYLQRLRALGVQTGVPMMFGVTATKEGFGHLKFIDDSVAAGARMWGLSRCRDISGVLSFHTTLPFDKLPAWKALRSLPVEEQLRQLSQPEMRQRMVMAASEGNYGETIGIGPRKADYDRVYVYRRTTGSNPTVAEEARARGMDPADLMIDLALQTHGEVFFIQPMERQLTENLIQFLKHPRAIMTFSDSGAHVSQISDCSIQTQLLGEFVRERGTLTLEEGVRMITFNPAMAFSITDRGLVREGMIADLNVFDPATIAPEIPALVRDLPTGAQRLIQKARGISATIVGGAVTFENGQHTGALNGQVLRSRSVVAA